MIPADDVARDEALVVRRLIPVARERVFAAWLDPAGMTRWMCPFGGRATVALDARVGGAFRIDMEHGGGGSTAHWGEYLVVDPPAQLSFTWISEHTELRATVVTVDFLERGPGTEVVLTHRGLPPTQLESHRRGWSDIMRQLEETLALAPGDDARAP